MKRLLFLGLLAISIICPAKELRLGSYNLRMHQIDKGENLWEVRRERLMESIHSCEFDVFGVQEVSSVTQDFLRERLGKEYGLLFFSPYSQDGKGNKAHGIVYRKDRIKLLDYHFFWPSDDPWTISNNDRSWVEKKQKYHYYKRGGICATLKDRKSGKRFFLIVSHWALDQELNAKYAQVYIDIEKQFNPKALPSFFVGDLNTRPSSESSALFRSYWKDSAIGVDEENTFNAFGKKKTEDWPDGRFRIDYIYYRNLGEVPEYHCDRSLFGGLYASDHYPIYVDVDLKAKPFSLDLVKDYKAASDGVTMVTEKLQEAIDDVSEQGGGRVVLRGGVFLSGPVKLKDGVELHIEKGATLLASPKLTDFPNVEMKHVDTQALPRWRNAAFIYADEARDIAISGEGTIDCNGSYHIRRKSDPDWKGWEYERIAPREESLPRVVFFAGCRGVRVSDVTMVGQPAGWSYWVHDCDYVDFDGCKILADVRYPNNDGIHVNCSRDVRISRCKIECGDDAIVLRANSRSLKENKACERVRVNDCELRSWSSAVRIGWVNDGVIRDCRLRKLRIHDSSNGIGCYLPLFKYVVGSNDYGREATLVENMSFEDIVMDGIYGNPVYFKVPENDPEVRLEGFRNIVFSRVKSRALCPPYVREQDSSEIIFKDCSFETVPDGSFPGDASRHGYVLRARL